MVNKPRQDGDKKTFSDSMGTSANAIPVNAFKSLRISDSQDNPACSSGTASSGLFNTQQRVFPQAKSSSGQFGGGFNSSDTSERRPFSLTNLTRDNKSTQKSSSVQSQSPSGLKSSSRQFGNAFNSSPSRPFSLTNLTHDRKSTQKLSSVQLQSPSGSKSSSWQFGNAFNSSDTSESRPFSLKSSNFDSKLTQESSSPASFVKSELVGKFIALPTTEMSMEEFEWRHLNEKNVRDDVSFDLNEGFDKNVVDYSKFWYSSVKHLFKFIMAKATDGTSLKEAVHGSEFVASRGSLAYFASRVTFISVQQENDKPPKLEALFVLTKFEGVVFINRIYAVVSDERGERKTKRMNRKFYQSHKLIHKLTTKNSKDDLDFDKFGSSYDMHFGVFKAHVTDSTGRKISCFISSKIDGQDKAGNLIEIKEHFGLTQKHPRYEPEPRWYLNLKANWWMQASLANVDRFIVGMHDADMVVKRVGELCMSGIKKSKKQWKPEDCIEFLLDTFKEAQELLDSKPEGAILKLETFTNRKEPAMTWIEDDEREQYKFLPLEFIERFSTPK